MSQLPLYVAVDSQALRNRWLCNFNGIWGWASDKSQSHRFISEEEALRVGRQEMKWSEDRVVVEPFDPLTEDCGT